MKDKKRKFKSLIILTKLETVNYLTSINLLFYLTYNTIMGWNKTPQSHLEEVLDNIAVITLYIIAGLILNIVLSYIKFKMERYLAYYNTLNQNKKEQNNKHIGRCYCCKDDSK